MTCTDPDCACTRRRVARSEAGEKHAMRTAHLLLVLPAQEDACARTAKLPPD